MVLMFQRPQVMTILLQLFHDGAFAPPIADDGDSAPAMEVSPFP